MIDGFEPLSCVLWAVVAFAAGMYPLGLMLGGACSECCEKKCEPPFYRCLRVKSVNKSVPAYPSFFAYTLQDAGIIKASTTAAATVNIGIAAHQHMSGGEVADYKVDLEATASAGAVCSGVVKEYTFRVEGRDFPLLFSNLSLPDQYAGLGLAATAVAGGNPDVSVNLNAQVSASVVAATAASAGSGELLVDGSELTQSVLKSMLTVSAPRFPASSFGGATRDPKIDVTLAGNGAIFRYITSPAILTWLVCVNRGAAKTYFQVSVRVWHQTPVAVPEGGLPALALSPLPALANTPEPPLVPPAIDGTTITLKANRSTTHIFSLPVDITLSGACMVDAAYLNFTAPKQATGFEPPAGLGQAFFASSAAASLSLDTYVFRYNQFVGSGENYDTAQVQEYRDGMRSMTLTKQNTDYSKSPTVSTTDFFDLLIAEPSPMCGRSMCELPQELLPSGVTYEPASGVKWDCKPARRIVLGNPDGGCAYSHWTNECRGTGGASVYLQEFFTEYKLRSTMYGSDDPAVLIPPDALTWLEFVEDAKPLVKANGTYTLGGQYDPADGRYGACYGEYDLFGSGHPRQFVGHAWRGGTCPAASQTVTITSSMGWGDGDYVCSAQSVSCDGASYIFASSDPTIGYTSEVQLRIGVGWRPDAAWVKAPTEGLSSDPCNAIEYKSLYCSFGKDFNSNGLPMSGYTAIGWDPPIVTGSGTYFGFGSLGIDARIYGALASGSGSASLLASSDLLSQCSGVTFSPTTITLPSPQPNPIWSWDNKNLSVSDPERGPGDVTASGPAAKCGYGWLLGGASSGIMSAPYRTSRYLGGGIDYTAVWPAAYDKSKPLSQKRWLVSDGSTPQQVTITRPGSCTSLWVYTTTYYSPANPSITTPGDGTCVLITAAPTGSECKWTAASSVDWITLNEESANGVGVQTIRVTVAANTLGFARSGVVTVTLKDDPSVTATATIFQDR